MNCRAKTLFNHFMQLRVWIIHTLFSCLVAFAIFYINFGMNIAEAQQLTESQIPYSPKIPYIDVGSMPGRTTYPEWLYTRMKSSKGWQPSIEATSQCKLSFSSVKLSPEKCEANYDLSFWEKFLSKLYVGFDVSDLKKFQHIQFEPQPGLKIRGLLALQEKQNRPLVILRMGIHGNIDEFMAERFLVRILYQDLGYNLLMLESLTSHGFLTLNDQITVGGIEEGLHTFYILNLITHNKMPWSKFISDIYLMGISLGGQGVFVANYLDENTLRNGVLKKSVKAIELFCPLINLQETFLAHEKPSLTSALIDIWNRRRFLALREKYSDLENIPWWQSYFDFTPRFMPAAMSLLNIKQPKPIFNLATLQKEFPDLKLPQEFINHIEKSQSLFELNNFWPIYKNQETPLKIFVTPKDPAVINELNSDRIRNGSQPGVFKKVKFLDLKGLHCAIAAEYQWPFLVEMIKQGFEKSN